MAVVPKFTKQDITKAINTKMQQIEKAVLSRLQRIGETFVTNARTNGQYTDRTGNLRSSIGYVILKNGLQHTSGGFEQIKKGSEGKIKGRRILADVAGQYPTGFVLIVVAGMDYAAAVESKGKDVLTGSSQTAVIQLREAMDSIRRKVA